jgi:peptidoglycan hydrolase-like protein with peptidoglycan-binding domain
VFSRRPIRGWPISYPVEACPEVGRSGNWFRSGDRLVLLLDEDPTPLAGGAEDASAAVPNGDLPAEPNGGAPAEPDAGAPSEPDGGAPSEPPEGAQGELYGARRSPSWRLRRIQRALNQLRRLRLRPTGVADPQTRSALRSYQRQKGLAPHGQADYQTEAALTYEMADALRGYELEGPEIDSCVRRCKESLDSCIAAGGGLQCLANWSTCLQSCAFGTEPPPTPTPVPPTPPGPCPPRPTLRLGSTGRAVMELQSRLNANGATPPLKVDGSFGPVTGSAVRAFQRSRGLTADGIVGPKTWAKLGC